MLDGEHLARAPEPGDHLVADQQGAQLGRQGAQLAQVAGGRHDVARRALNRLHDDRGDVVRRLERDLLPQEVHAMPVAGWEGLAERAAGARGVGARVGTGRQRPETVLEAAAQQRENTPRLPVKTAPESHDLVLAGRGLGQPHRRLDGFGAARVQLGAVQVAGRDAGDQLHQLRAVLGGEAPHVHALELACHLGDVARVRVAEARHTDAGEQVHVTVAVHVPEHGALAPVHAQLAEQGDALGPGRQVPRLGVEDAPGLRSELDHAGLPFPAFRSM